jgi:hypothetical protein
VDTLRGTLRTSGPAGGGALASFEEYARQWHALSDPFVTVVPAPAGHSTQR